MKITQAGIKALQATAGKGASGFGATWFPLGSQLRTARALAKEGFGLWDAHARTFVLSCSMLNAYELGLKVGKREGSSGISTPAMSGGSEPPGDYGQAQRLIWTMGFQVGAGRHYQKLANAQIMSASRAYAVAWAELERCRVSHEAGSTVLIELTHERNKAHRRLLMACGNTVLDSYNFDDAAACVARVKALAEDTHGDIGDDFSGGWESAIEEVLAAIQNVDHREQVPVQATGDNLQCAEVTSDMVCVQSSSAWRCKGARHV